jgi:hypothetical protein
MRHLERAPQCSIHSLGDLLLGQIFIVSGLFRQLTL